MMEKSQVLEWVSRRVGRSTGTRGISSFLFRKCWIDEKQLKTYRTSRGVPARLRILTTACGPPAPSNARSAVEESTRTHRRVSRTADVRGGGGGAVDLSLTASEEADGGGVG